MPRISAVPPQILLASSNSKFDPMIAVEEEPEPLTKTAEVQTMYRESETQTNPYAPEYTVKPGDDPEILMLSGLTFENGLPAGPKEMIIIQHARTKRELDNNMLPFTDEVCFMIRKKMMERQELREFKLREEEIDSKREMRLITLKQALEEREESNEFLSSQRVEAVRQTLMETREESAQKIRKNRIKVLRRLACQRNTVDPILTNLSKRDIINEYFDRGSEAYAPLRRFGRINDNNYSHFEVLSRTAPLSVPSNVDIITEAIPARVLKTAKTVIDMSKTVPLFGLPGGRNSQDYETSARRRAVRNTKKDVESMHLILTRQKELRSKSAQFQFKDMSSSGLDKRNNAADTAEPHTADLSNSGGLVRKTVKGRPRTPNLATNDRQDSEMQAVFAACMLLQKLIRGRAVQNTMFEGRYRRAELISELRAADEFIIESENVFAVEEQAQIAREKQLVDVRETTLQSIVGNIASNILTNLACEKHRIEVIDMYTTMAAAFAEERFNREAAEAGRRQREGLSDQLVQFVPSAYTEPEVVEMELPQAAVDEEGSVFASLNSSLPKDILEALLPKEGQPALDISYIIDNIDLFPSLLENFRKFDNERDKFLLCRDVVSCMSPMQENEKFDDDDSSLNSTKQEMIGALMQTLAFREEGLDKVASNAEDA